ncbi:MAG: prepilin-type N-terminal cleavage/methylation domain-containing protein [Planctomycetes bacterium]|nr:prepilin-type N-terminal cleavage/methylation domain-containing protein [Planctomycetota bacterium]
MRRNRGFTLLEIMIAFSILLAGVVGVYAVFAAGLVAHKRAVDNTTAAVLAGSLFDDIAANYDVWYYDRDHDGTPDLGEDGNNNGTPDWFELDSGGRPRYPVPQRGGYRYTVRYERSDVVPQELFVTAQVYWRQENAEKSATFRRSIFLKNLPELEP